MEGLDILSGIAVLALISLFWAQNAVLAAQPQPAHGWPSGICYMYTLYIRLILRRENAHISRIPVDIAVGAAPSTGCTVQYISTMERIPAVNLGVIVP